MTQRITTTTETIVTIDLERLRLLEVGAQSVMEANSAGHDATIHVAPDLILAMVKIVRAAQQQPHDADGFVTVGKQERPAGLAEAISHAVHDAIDDYYGDYDRG